MNELLLRTKSEFFRSTRQWVTVNWLKKHKTAGNSELVQKHKAAGNSELDKEKKQKVGFTEKFHHTCISDVHCSMFL